MNDVIGTFSPDARWLESQTNYELEYDFYPLNHSVVRSAFGSTPCIPYEWTGPGRVGFFSGFRPVNLVLSDVRGDRSMEATQANGIKL